MNNFLLLNIDKDQKFQEKKVSVDKGVQKDWTDAIGQTKPILVEQIYEELQWRK